MKYFLLLMMMGCSVLQKKNPDISKYNEKCFQASFDSTMVACTYSQVKTPTYTILYMHGLLEDETVFRKSFFDESSLWTLMDKNPNALLVIPSVRGILNLSYSWSLTPNDPRENEPKAATVPKMVRFLRSMKLPGPINLFGQSMGAHNAAELAFGQSDIPFASYTFTHGMFTQAKYGDKSAKAMWEISFNFSEKEWAKGSPFVLAHKLEHSLVEATKDDQFGLYDADKALAGVIGATFVDDPPGVDHYSWSVDAVNGNLVRP